MEISRSTVYKMFCFTQLKFSFRFQSNLHGRLRNNDVQNSQISVQSTKVIFPKWTQWYVGKLGMIKQFVKALDLKGYCFSEICRKFPKLGIEKLKSGIFGTTITEKYTFQSYECHGEFGSYSEE